MDLEKTVSCPECNKLFVSELSLKNHFRNLHDIIHHGEVFETVMVHEKHVFPEKTQNINQILNSIRQNVFAKQRERLTRARRKIADNNAIKASIERTKHKVHNSHN